MNLYLLFSRKEKSLLVTPGVTLASRRVRNDTWRGLSLEAGDAPQIVISGATAFYPIRERPETAGWWAAGEAGAELKVYFADPETGRPVSRVDTLQLDAAPQPVRLPWDLESLQPSRPLDLVIHAPSGSKGVFLGVFRALDRDPLIKLCVGRGVEIGPGTTPKILPSDEVDVSYVEQMSAEDWARLYGDHFGEKLDASQWSRYVVGDAHALPCDDDSLDFIFSSHVFEHLANPLGHLEYWGRKLKAGGKLVGIIPDLSGASDFRASLSTLADFLGEYEDGEMAPTYPLFEKAGLAQGFPATKLPRMWEARKSIHLHFYSHSNMAVLLREAVKRFGYQGFAIQHTPNHKDFYFVATR